MENSIKKLKEIINSPGGILVENIRTEPESWVRRWILLLFLFCNEAWNLINQAINMNGESGVEWVS